MKWKKAPIIKIYEALGALGDGRVEVEGSYANVYSSSRNKFYVVEYDPEQNSITSNDNGSYWQKYLGYPSIAYLLARGIVKYEKKWEEALKEFAWKDMNTKFKNDFAKTEAYIRAAVEKRGYRLAELDKELASIAKQLNELELEILPSTRKPPTAY